MSKQISNRVNSRLTVLKYNLQSSQTIPMQNANRCHKLLWSQFYSNLQSYVKSNKNILTDLEEPSKIRLNKDEQRYWFENQQRVYLFSHQKILREMLFRNSQIAEISQEYERKFNQKKVDIMGLQDAVDDSLNKLQAFEQNTSKQITPSKNVNFQSNKESAMSSITYNNKFKITQQPKQIRKERKQSESESKSVVSSFLFTDQAERCVKRKFFVLSSGDSDHLKSHQRKSRNNSILSHNHHKSSVQTTDIRAYFEDDNKDIENVQTENVGSQKKTRGRNSQKRVNLKTYEDTISTLEYYQRFRTYIKADITSHKLPGQNGFSKANHLKLINSKNGSFQAGKNTIANGNGNTNSDFVNKMLHRKTFYTDSCSNNKTKLGVGFNKTEYNQKFFNSDNRTIVPKQNGVDVKNQEVKKQLQDKLLQTSYSNLAVKTPSSHGYKAKGKCRYNYKAAVNLC